MSATHDRRVVVVTGHRPQTRLGFKPKKSTTPRAIELLDRFAEHVFQHIAEPDDIWRTGGQRGWDLAISKAVVNCCPTAGIDLTLFLPFPEFAQNWKPSEQQALAEAVTFAGKRIIWAIDNHPKSKEKALYLRRNDDMLLLGKKPDLVVSLWDGEEDEWGGTRYTIKRAEDIGIKVINSYDAWKRFAIAHAPDLVEF